MGKILINIAEVKRLEAWISVKIDQKSLAFNEIQQFTGEVLSLRDAVT